MNVLYVFFLRSIYFIIAHYRSIYQRSITLYRRRKGRSPAVKTRRPRRGFVPLIAMTEGIARGDPAQLYYYYYPMMHQTATIFTLCGRGGNFASRTLRCEV